MTSTALLNTYRKVRDVVGEIHGSATAIEEHLGRFQVYGDHEQMDHAMAEADRLAEKLQNLLIELHRCACATGAHRERGTQPRTEARSAEGTTLEQAEVAV
jgi:hypothetical protein